MAIDSKLEVVKENTAYIENILNDLVVQYTGEIDNTMLGIQRDVIGDEYPSAITIEKYFAQLSVQLYWLSEKVEKAGVYDSVSKALATETYNNKYIEYQHHNDGIQGAKKPTVAEIQAVSESAALEDNTVNILYNKCYKTIKNKFDAGNQMVSTLSKMLSRRMQEVNMSNPSGKQILNESV